MCFHLYIYSKSKFSQNTINLLNPELNPICYLLALLGAHHFLHVSRIRVKSLTLRLLMSYTECPKKIVPFSKIFLWTPDVILESFIYQKLGNKSKFFSTLQRFNMGALRDTADI